MTSNASAWARVPIKQTYLGLYDGPHATPKPAEEGPVFLGIGNVTDDGHLDLSSVRHISEGEFARWTKRVEPTAGDIVFTYEATLNRYALIPEGFRGCLGRRMALIRPNLKVVDQHFLFYYFFCPDWRETIASNVWSGATVDRIPLTNFPEFPVSLPPLPTQQRIASILSAYDDLIENNTRRIAILEEMARRLYAEWFVHFRFPGHEAAEFEDDLPRGWIKALVEDFGQVITGKTPTKKRAEFFGGDVPFLRLPDMHRNIFAIQTSDTLTQSGANSQKGKLIPKGSLCVSCIGTVGIIIICYMDLHTNQQINSIILKDKKSREFLFFVIRGLKGTIERYAATGATMANLSRGKFAALSFPSPPHHLISQFHEACGPFFDTILLLQRKNANLRAQRDLLLPKLISGEIDVSDAAANFDDAAA
jgi:type I restriction enzyme S subunit